MQCLVALVSAARQACAEFFVGLNAPKRFELQQSAARFLQWTKRQHRKGT